MNSFRETILFDIEKFQEKREQYFQSESFNSLSLLYQNDVRNFLITIEACRNIVVETAMEIINSSVTKSSGAEMRAWSEMGQQMSEEDYAYLKSKGADRYLLKHETADPVIYSRLHPCGTLENRTNCLKTIHKLGYETGSGFMIGLPGQTLETIAEDLLLLRDIPCQMAGIGPFISNPKTALAGEKNGDPELTRRAVALARLLLPKANLPVTTALSLMTKEEHEQNPFAFGANVVMKKVTPDQYKEAYEIYPADFKPTDIAGDRKELEEIIKSYGRMPL